MQEILQPVRTSPRALDSRLATRYLAQAICSSTSLQALESIGALGEMSQMAGYMQGSPGGFSGQAPYYPQQQQYPPSAGYNNNPFSSSNQAYMSQTHSYPSQPEKQQQAPQSSTQGYYASPSSFQEPPAYQQQQEVQQQQTQLQGGQPNQIDRATDPRGWALAEYGSPFAHFKDWRASPADLELTGFPQQKLMLRVKQRFARSPGDVWSKPAPSFGRSPQQGCRYAPFQPFSLPAAGEQLADGFKPLYPGRILADHDVSAADWSRFLEDIQVAGRMTGAQQVISQVAPVTAHLGATGYFVTKAIQKRMKRGKEPVIAETIEMWQQNFFLRRGVDVYVRDTEGRITGLAPGEPLPGINHSAPVELEHNRNDDSDDDSSDVGIHHELSHKEKKKERKERKEKHKEEKKKKKKDERKNKKKPQFYLIVASYQPM